MPFDASKPFAWAASASAVAAISRSFAFCVKSEKFVQTSGNAALPLTALFGMKPSTIMPASAAASRAFFTAAASSTGMSPCAIARSLPTFHEIACITPTRYSNAWPSGESSGAAAAGPEPWVHAISGISNGTIKASFVLLGQPIPSHLAHHERLSRVTGLAVLSSDALSSVAYATDFILATLVVAGVGAFVYAIPISVIIATLLAIVAFSYRQTIHAYPTGGGAYIVAKENIGANAGLIAGASLLVDYTLTVAVSISAGVLALTSAFPQLDTHRVAICLLFLALLTIGNLRGIRESGNIFAVPTYFFVFSIMLLLAAGLYRYVTGGIVPVDAALPPNAGHQPVTTFLLLTAFANGCTAMTGVEAVSNGVPAFRPPEAKNASATLVAMATLAVGMFVGITVLAHAYQVVPNSAESGVSQLGRAIFGGPNVFYYLLQAGTMLILVLAANTAYADFPRLASIVSRDHYLPRQFMNQGDRLAFSNGILVLSVFAAMLIIAFRGDTQSLLPLYMIGVFVSFTLVAGRHGDPLAADAGAGLERPAR